MASGSKLQKMKSTFRIQEQEQYFQKVMCPIYDFKFLSIFGTEFMNNSSYTSGRTWKREVWKQGDNRSQYLGKQGKAGPEGKMSRTR